MTASIFVNVAAYREFELVRTLRDCLAQAEDPRRLRFCVCWQHDETDSLEELERDPRLEIIDVPYRESQGVCWARHQIQRRWAGEPYTLQIDGHHRFAPGWDRTLIDMIGGLQRRGVARPILTARGFHWDTEAEPAGWARRIRFESRENERREAKKTFYEVANTVRQHKGLPPRSFGQAVPF